MTSTDDLWEKIVVAVLNGYDKEEFVKEFGVIPLRFTWKDSEHVLYNTLPTGVHWDASGLITLGFDQIRDVTLPLVKERSVEYKGIKVDIYGSPGEGFVCTHALDRGSGVYSTPVSFLRLNGLPYPAHLNIQTLNTLAERWKSEEQVQVGQW